jgi:phosphoribosylcarboxyaminoimidazole (NCAIR) mutase
LALRMLALADPSLANALEEYRHEIAGHAIEQDQTLPRA